MKAVTINHQNKTITLTKEFAKKASEFGTQEYKELMEIKAGNREYSVEVRTAPKRKSKTSRVTLEDIKAYVKKHDETGELQAKLDEMTSKESGVNITKVSFFEIKAWFFEQYPELKENAA